MIKKNNEPENIELSLPVNAAYVSAARLTASSIANRLGFDIDEIEDIKAAVSESCIYIIKKAAESKTNLFKLTFRLSDGHLEIMLCSDVSMPSDEQEAEMSLLMIKALMDTLELSAERGDAIEIKMSKRHKKNIL
ncbi:MAG: ATP-binding protein [Clostridiales bacterium]|jgi:serine/threonine-protein kinase RsbW|nr:ATP-binding protein [Clostridiales bacterium]